MKRLRCILILLFLVGVAFAQPAPNISNITNAAFPSLNMPPGSLYIPPRSIISIFGTDLADTTEATSPPWKTTLGGTEVHLASDTCFEASCDVVLTLLYAGPTQINAFLPMTGPTPEYRYRIVLVRDGIRIDNRLYMIGGPGRIFIDSSGTQADFVFEIGYDCLYSYSVSDPASCGLSWASGNHRAPSSAVTDAKTGELINSRNPVYQGRLISIWMTGLYGIDFNQQDGMWEGYAPSVNFGVAQLGKDLTGSVPFPRYGQNYNNGVLQNGVLHTDQPLWAGESPQYPGLDQINVAFPTCLNSVVATSEKRYDAFMAFADIYGIEQRLYLPFVVRAGDKDCFAPPPPR